MSRFTSLLKVSPLPDGRSWVLLEPLTYEVGELGSADVITVPRGFVTDFASVPRLLWVLFPRQGFHQNAAVVHDWLYWSHSRSRRASDYVFLEGMGVLGTLISAQYLMFWAVRAFGWMAWWHNEKDRAAGINRVIDVLPLATDPVPSRGIRRIVANLFKREVQ